MLDVARCLGFAGVDLDADATGGRPLVFGAGEVSIELVVADAVADADPAVGACSNEPFLFFA
jgi:hypothetical protein